MVEFVCIRLARCAGGRGARYFANGIGGPLRV